MIRFEINGRPVDPANVGDALMHAALEDIKGQIQDKVGAIRDPKTGEFPTIVVRGDSLDNLRINVEGSPEVIELVKKILGLHDENEETMGTSEVPRVFLCYTSSDTKLAESIATLLQENGIDTWWDKWCIAAGDSLREKIDEGLSECTHFLVLLTPHSIDKPWVNQEMDAGLVLKLKNECRFLPVRHNLPASDLPPLLAGMYSPEITTNEDITQLINDIYGVARSPAHGTAPKSVEQAQELQTGYSPAATVIAGLLVVHTKHGMLGDPRFTVDDLSRDTGLTVSDVKDGLYELSSFIDSSHNQILVKPELFAEFDRFWKPWNPAEDALTLAADMSNDADCPTDCKDIADRYGWEARRLNPAITYLDERGMLFDTRTMGTSPFVIRIVMWKEDEIRRFVKS